MSSSEIIKALIKLGGEADIDQLLDAYVKVHYPPGYQWNRKDAKTSLGTGLSTAMNRGEIKRRYSAGQRDIYYINTETPVNYFINDHHGSSYD